MTDASVPDCPESPVVVQRQSFGRVERPYMDAPGFAMASVRDGIKEQIAPVHPDFACGLVPLSLMGLAGRLPIAFTHSQCFGRFGFGQPRSDLFAIIA